MYYGIGQITDLSSDVLPKMGGEILISEGLPRPGMSLNPLRKNTLSLTDENGYYAVSGLDPGHYTVSVFMEDEKYQMLHLGLIQTHLEYLTCYMYHVSLNSPENRQFWCGKKQPGLVARSTRQLSRIPDRSSDEEFDLEYRSSKRLYGIGRGFNPDGLPPVLSFIPDPGNFGKTVPRVNVGGLG